MNNQQNETVQGKILIVDDNLNNQRFLANLLIEQGYEVISSTNSTSALKAIQTAPPDLILLKIIIPESDGYQIPQQLKADELTCHLPIIFLGTTEEAVDPVKAFARGAVDYINEPFHLQEILARVGHQLNIRHLQKRLTEQNLLLQQEKSNYTERNTKGEHQQLELKLQQSKEETKSFRQELEELADIVSHDLQQPLININSFTQLLARKYQNVLDAKAQNYINHILAGTDQMQKLINDLLAYSRIRTRGQEFQLTNCNNILEWVLSRLTRKIRESSAYASHDTLPILMGDEQQLRLLFQNLISNAIKFHRQEVQPQIKITLEQRDNEWLFAVHDNGIGIAPDYFERIFAPCQRLHTDKEYPGTGLGLAISKKIVERHRGRIWVESQLGLGTSFYFTLPK
ncbi:MAG: ATP-binding protein [Coleofasciculaceae cyanobacterium]